MFNYFRRRQLKKRCQKIFRVKLKRRLDLMEDIIAASCVVAVIIWIICFLLVY